MSDRSSSVLDARLADIVRDDPRITPVFERFGLDYCCQGQRTLQEASRDHHIPISDILHELQALGARPATSAARNAWPDLAALIRHIVNTHHRYVREHQPILQAWLDKLTARHGARHPELHQASALFGALSRELLQHMEKEESILFPYIQALWAARESGQPPPASPFGTVMNPIRAMEQEHRDAGDLLARLRIVTDGYQPPADGCTTYGVCFAELARFEADLHQHVHLENHVLFPRTVALEGSLG